MRVTQAKQLIKQNLFPANPKRMVVQKMGFDIVHGCQLRCIGCPNSVLKPKIRHITLSDFQTCMENIDVGRVQLLRLFNFGEPLLHPKLPEIVGSIRDFGFEVDTVEISTNAQQCNFDHLTEIIKGRTLDRLVASCDGDGTPEEYERLRTPSKWDKFVHFLQKASALRDQHNPELVLMTRSICTTEEGKARWRRLLEPLGWTPEFRGWLELPEAVRTLSKLAGARNGLCKYMSDKHYTCYFDEDGTVVPCCIHPRAFTLGNLKTEKLSSLLTSSRRSEMQAILRSNRASLPICAKCDAFGG